jgi:cbb3-type cytochrome oxidase subunit 3
MIENGRTMFLHSLIICIILYIFMIFILGQKQVIAENRSILLSALILIYMILFGHGLPMSINKKLF